MKYTILVTGAGGVGGIGFTRSIKHSGEKFNIIGIDCNKFKLQRAETDIKILIPSIEHPCYVDILIEIIKKYNVDFLHIQTSAETLLVSEVRSKIPCQIFLPYHETVLTCADKFESYRLWKNCGIKVPSTFFICNMNDLEHAFKELGPEIWLRYRVGSGGIGSLPTNNLDMARHWLDRLNGWGKFLASTRLENRTVTFESIWKEGELIVAQQRERLYWEHSNRAPSGVSGITGTSVTLNMPIVTEIALKCINSVDQRPNGILSVDFTFDKTGLPNPTEINAGRFMATNEFFTRAGVNFPFIFISYGLGLTPPYVSKRINPINPGLAWIRGMDIQPIIMNISEINLSEDGLTLTAGDRCIQKID